MIIKVLALFEQSSFIIPARKASNGISSSVGSTVRSKPAVQEGVVAIVGGSKEGAELHRLPGIATIPSYKSLRFVTVLMTNMAGATILRRKLTLKTKSLKLNSS
jgi:hypothetical protein